MVTKDLFASGPIDALAAFDRWAGRARGKREFHESTIAVQRAMWAAFVAWCLQRGIEPSKLTALELSAYLQSREGSSIASELTPRYAWRLVRLIGLVADFMACEEGLSANTAAAELLRDDRTLRLANDQGSDVLPEFLLVSEDRLLTSFLASSVPRAGKDVGLRWQDIRNRTAVALQRGAGLTPLEIRELRVSHVHVDRDPKKGAWKVRAPATGLASEHEAPVAKWARPLLAAWLTMRTALEVPGAWLFPSTRTGKPLSKTVQFEATAQVLSAAGLVGPSASGGGYKLRNTFAMRQLSVRTNTDADVAAWLGIDVHEMTRYRRVLAGPVDVA